MATVQPVERRRFPFAFAFAIVLAGCGGDSCSCMEPIPGGFPDDQRTANGAQVRVTSSGIAAIESDPAALVGGLLGTGNDTTFDVPPSCGGDTAICCPGGTPQMPCGPIDIDLEPQPGDLPRLEINPIAGNDRVDLVVRARVSTLSNMAVTAAGTDCEIAIDTTNAGNESITINAAAQLSQDPDTGTTRIDVGTVDVTDIDNDDIDLSGGFLCFFGDLFAKGTIVSQLETALEDQLGGLIGDQLCKACDDVSECGPHADRCEGGVCLKPNDDCINEVGIAGRIGGASLLGGFSPGTQGKMDVYEVLGGYGTTESDGIALGMLSGMLPAGTERDRCGPTATPPDPVTITQSAFFQGNTRPDTNNAFDVGIGVHQHNLDLAAYAAYEGGLLCLNVGTRSVDLLNSETLAVLMPSYIDLLHGQVGQMVLALRPQSPPTILLGPGTFLENGDIDEPLLNVSFTGLEIDFFGMVDEQYIRLMTLTADVALPINLDLDENGDILPVLGDVEDAFTNLSVTNSEALAESPAELENKVPALLSLALPFVADGLGSFALPELGGLSLSIQPDGITSVENNTFLAIFADLVVGGGTMAAPAPRVRTEARIVEIARPTTEAFRATRLDPTVRPTVELEFAGETGDGLVRDLEWSYRLDGGLWSPYTRDRRVVLSRDSLWLQGRHTVEVRAREVGAPLTTDPTPVVLRPIIDTLPPVVRFSRPTDDTVFVLATDNVSKGAMKVEYRWPGGSWQIADRVPVAIPTDGRDPKGLEVRVTDEGGNATSTSPAIIGFHGTASGDSGCSCATGGGDRGGLALLLGFVCLALAGRTRRRLWRAARAAGGPLLSLLLVGALSALVPACSCGGSETVCAGETGECAEGEVERGPTGRWSSIAVSADRTVISAYEEGLGDLVMIEQVGGELTYRAVDGVPFGNLPIFDPKTYRGGIVEPGPNVGAWTSIELVGGRARIAYQDIDAGVVKFAEEIDEQTFQIHVVDSDTGGGVLGAYTSLAYDGSGVPAIVYMAVGVRDGAGGRTSQLRYARASSATPGSESSWTVSILDEAPISCAGLCDDGQACLPTDTGEVCTATTNDCTDSCGDGQACIGGSCTDIVPDPAAYDLPGGVGLFADLDFLPDGRPVVVYYDRVNTDLIMQVSETAWTRIELDADPDTDTGMNCDLAVAPDGTVHVAYQDALGDQLFYTSWAGGMQRDIELVDDGTRSGETRPHPVGAGAAVLISGGNPAIAYQDGATADLVLATRSGDSWMRSDLLSGITLDGFFVDADSTDSRAGISSYRYDRAFYPPGELVITTIP